MKCAPGGQLADGGGEVTVLIRPEQATLVPFARSAEGITGKVTEAWYHAGTPAPWDEVCLTATGQVTAWPEGSF
jgi:hypothetical protein